MASKVLIIYTGGTIGMMEDPSSRKLRPFDFSHLTAQVPELNKLDVELSSLAFEQPIDSSDMKPHIWIRLAEMIENNYSAFDGFVVLHGSDTMAYTASALSFLLEGLAKPVILTGSQLPIGTIRTDGKENLLSAIEIAAAKNESGQPMVPEVAIYFEYRLLRGNRTSKVSANHFNAFSSGNYPLLAEAGITIAYDLSAICQPANTPLKVHKQLESNIALLKLFPGITHHFVKAIAQTEGLKGLILETFGAGNATTENWFIAELEQLIKRGIPVVNITQCASGSVDQGKYETSSALARIGVISGYDLTTEAAVCKMMFLLAGRSKDFKGDFQRNIAGELSV